MSETETKPLLSEPVKPEETILNTKEEIAEFAKVSLDNEKQRKLEKDLQKLTQEVKSNLFCIKDGNLENTVTFFVHEHVVYNPTTFKLSSTPYESLGNGRYMRFKISLGNLSFDFVHDKFKDKFHTIINSSGELLFVIKLD
jgi:hypothetical protein